MPVTIDGTTGITTPALDSAARFATGDMPLGSVLQVVQTVKTDAFSASVSATTTAEPTGFNVSITPSNTSNRILVIANFNMGVGAGGIVNAVLKRNGSNIFIGDASGTQERRTVVRFACAAANAYNATITFLDAPSTTSSTTYSVGIGSDQSATIYLNRADSNDNQTFMTRGASSIIAMEIAA